LGGATYGAVLERLSKAELPLPRTSEKGARNKLPVPGDGCSRNMSRDLKNFVVDTGPLIALAVAQSLDYLLYVEADVVIPDIGGIFRLKTCPLRDRAGRSIPSKA
jgi:hypothetical protein